MFYPVETPILTEHDHQNSITCTCGSKIILESKKPKLYECKSCGKKHKFTLLTE